jgi:hypothetical protein
MTQLSQLFVDALARHNHNLSPLKSSYGVSDGFCYAPCIFPSGCFRSTRPARYHAPNALKITMSPTRARRPQPRVSCNCLIVFITPRIAAIGAMQAFSGPPCVVTRRSSAGWRSRAFRAADVAMTFRFCLKDLARTECGQTRPLTSEMLYEDIRCGRADFAFGSWRHCIGNRTNLI